MTPIRRILCPVDLSPLSRAEVTLAAGLARTLGAELVLHHNLSATGPGLAKGWEWKENHPGAGGLGKAEAGMRSLLEAVSAGVEVHTLITDGPLTIGIERMAEELPADLVVLGCHGCTTEDHSSLTEVLLHCCDRPILALHESCGREPTPRLEAHAGQPLRFLVPTDLSPNSAAAVRYALDLAGGWPAPDGVRVHLLHVVEERRGPVRSLFARLAERAPAAEAQTDADARLAGLVPEHLADCVVVHVEAGRPDTAILRAAEEIAPDLIVMGEHARDPWGRLFTRDVAQSVLHGAPCPVWYVPPPKLAA